MTVKNYGPSRRAEKNSVFFAAFLRAFFALPIIAVLLSGTAAQAQPVPGPLVPGRQKPAELPQPTLKPQDAAAPAPSVMPSGAPPEGAEEITLQLNSITVTDSTIFTAADLQDIWQADLGKTVSVARLFQIAQQITARYAAQGYMLSFAFLPEQEIDNGNVIISVVEGYITDVVFMNADGSPDSGATAAPAIFRALSRDILRSRPLNRRDMERALLLMNDYPGLGATATFVPDPVNRGASRVNIVLTPAKPLSASLGGDNFLTEDLERYSVTARGSIVHRDIGAIDVSRGCGSSCRIYDYAAASWSKIVTAGGLKIGASASASGQKPEQGILAPIDFRGRSNDFNFEASYPLVRSRVQNLSLGARMTISNSDTNTFFGTLTRDRLRTADFFVNADLADTYGGSNTARATLSQGLPLFGYTRDNDPRRSRVNGSATFTTLDLYGAREQELSYFTPALSGYSLYVAAQARVAPTDPLLSGSQCFYGGNNFGRGYNSGAISGDHCLQGLMELRRDFFIGEQGFLRWYGFADVGAVYRKGDLSPGERRNDKASSLGTGLRFSLGMHAYGDLGVAFPIDKTGTPRGERNPKWLMSFTMTY